MLVIIDRLEGSYAVCEKNDNSGMLNIERALLPAEAKEGDVLSVDESGISINTDETEKRKMRISGLLNSLWE